MSARVLSVNVGRGFDANWAGRLKRTAIDKRPVPGRAAVDRLGLIGDQQVDRQHHGGLDKAVYSYAREDLDWWAGQLGRQLRDGHFGENLTTTGIDVNAAVIGEHWQVGSALLEVSRPRIPCVVFQNWLGENGWIKRFTAATRPGPYLRVLQGGELGAGDSIDVVYQPEHGFTIEEAFRAKTGERELASRVLDIPDLPPSWHEWARKVIDSNASV